MSGGLERSARLGADDLPARFARRNGLTNREIAERLSLSQHTIARHLANARTKLGAANRTEAAMKLEELENLARD